MGHSMRELMFGQADARMHAELDGHLKGVRELLQRRYGESLSVKQTLIEFDTLTTLPQTEDALVCKRAALLFALGKEKEVANYFAKRGDAFARDLAERALPLVSPLFFRNSCQAPDAFLLLTLVIAELWAGERLGCWPRAGRAHAPQSSH